MAVIEVRGLTYRYGKHTALRDLDFTVPEGALYALLGPNGSGKTTLLQVLMGLRRPSAGRVSLLGIDSAALTLRERATIGYIAEGQSLPGWMRLDQLERYLAPLYPTWDASLARDLRMRFALDPTRKIRTLSRGEQMKAALLVALAPRPKLLVMDEPFTGMDALVKDELVRGLLDSAGSEGWSVLLASHDIGELELLADWVGFLSRGQMRVSEPMEVLKARFKRVELTLDSGATTPSFRAPITLCSIERAENRASAVVSYAGEEPLGSVVRAQMAAVTSVDVREATLREIFVALAKHDTLGNDREVAA